MPDAVADVYIALQDDRGVPSWLDEDGSDTGSGIAPCEGSATRTCGVFRKRVNAGTVMLEPWNPVTSLYGDHSPVSGSSRLIGAASRRAAV